MNSFSCQCLPGFNGTYCELRKNLCNSNPCLNNATCSSGFGSYLCTCPPNYAGVNCQFLLQCDVNLNQCKNGAVCTKYIDGTYSCNCNPGFTGQYCDRIINACSSNPCLNGVTCFRYVSIKLIF